MQSNALCFTVSFLCAEDLEIYCSIFPFFSIYLSIYSSIHRYIRLFIYPSSHVPTFPSINVSSSLPAYLSINRLIYISTYLPIHLPTYSPINLSIYPSIRLSIYLSIHLSIYPSIHLSIYPSKTSCLVKPIPTQAWTECFDDVQDCAWFDTKVLARDFLSKRRLKVLFKKIGIKFWPSCL